MILLRQKHRADITQSPALLLNYLISRDEGNQMDLPNIVLNQSESHGVEDMDSTRLAAISSRTRFKGSIFPEL